MHYVYSPGRWTLDKPFWVVMVLLNNIWGSCHNRHLPYVLKLGMRSMLDSEICYLSIFFSFSVSQGHERVWYCQEHNILHLFLFGKHFSDVFITMLPSLDILRYGYLCICLTRNCFYVTHHQQMLAAVLIAFQSLLKEYKSPKQ